jgi:ribosomal protein S21
VIGTVVGNYRVVQLQGEDGFGTIYLAQHAAGWPASLRAFKPDVVDAALADRWFQAAQAAQASGHPGILHVVERFSAGRNAFLASSAIPGECLTASLQRDKRFWPEIVVKLGWQLSVALGSAHHAGAVHKVLRPDSIYVAQDSAAPGGVRSTVVDFGAAAGLGGTPDWRAPAVEALGMPFYMAPEVTRGGGDVRSDVYSLGCLLFHMAAGRPPYLGSSAPEIATAHQQMLVRGPAAFESSIPWELDQLVQRMIAKETGARPQSMEEVAAELERIAHQYWPVAASEQRTMGLDLRVGKPPPRHRAGRKWVILGAALVVVGGGAGALVALRPWQKHGAAATTAADAAPPPPAPDAAPPPRPASDLDVRLAEARGALDEERWADASAAARIAQKLDPKNEEAARILKVAKAEPANKGLYDDFHKAVDAGDVETALRRFKRVPAGSLYQKKAAAEVAKMREVFLKAKEAEARTLSEGKMCKRIEPIQKDVAKLFPDDQGRIKTIADACGK